MSKEKEFKNSDQSGLKLMKGTRLISFLFIAVSMLVAAGVLMAANIYYDIDTGEIVTEDAQKATSGVTVTGGGFEVSGGNVTFSTTGTINQTGSGQVTFSGNVDATSGLDVTGSNFTVGGSNFTVAPGSGNTSIAGTLDVTGDFAINTDKFTVTASSGNTSVAGTLGVTGAATFDSSVTIDAPSGAAQELRFMEGVASPTQYTGFEAPSVDLTSNKIYTLPDYENNPPSTDYVLTWQTGDEMRWKSIGGAGGGDIDNVGDCTGPDCFTADGAGNSLWFEGATANTSEVQLTAADPTADRTITLPDLSGNLTLTSGSLTGGSVLFSDSSGLIAQDNSNFYWDDTNDRLGIGVGTSPGYALDVGGTIRSGYDGTSGAVRIYSEQGTTDYKLVFQPSGSMTEDTTYTWPTDTGTNNYVLTTDGTSTLTWKSVSGAGGVDTSGTPAAGYVSYFSDSDTITGESAFQWDEGTDTLTVSGTGDFTTVVAPTVKNTGAALTLQTDTSGDVNIDPASGKIVLGSGDVIETATGGPASRASGEQILREMVPIMGFDLPARTNSGTLVNVSRVMETDPFASALSGTTRKHKFVIRYADELTSGSSSWKVNDLDTGNGDDSVTFTVPASATSDLSKGEVHIEEVDISTLMSNDDDWQLQVNTDGTNHIQVYQIFLAAYDQVD